MKRIYFLRPLLILICTTTSWAAGVNINQGHLKGSVSADNNPIIKVLNSDGTHRATQKAAFSWTVTCQVTVRAGSAGTLDLAPTGTLRKGTTTLQEGL